MRLFRTAAILVMLAVSRGSLGAEPLKITAAGATFPYPLYAKWFAEYHKLHPEVEFLYQPIGSGAGSKKLAEDNAFFSASDAPLTGQQIKEIGKPVLHIPTTIGGVAVIVNLPGLKNELLLSGAVLGELFLGRITKWNDTQIQRLNPGTALPDLDVTVVHRSDGSGTTYVFSEFLSKTSRAFAAKVGSGLTVPWPVGAERGGSSGVSKLVAEVRGAIGYCELAYAIEQKLTFASIQNGKGQFVAPSTASMEAAAADAAAATTTDFRISITDSKAPNAYPISSFTWLVVQERSSDRQRAKALGEFLTWALTEGQKYCAPLGYAPLPRPLAKLETEALASRRN